MSTYEIYEGNMDKLEEKLKKIGNKCKKYGCEFRYARTDEVLKEHFDESLGRKVTVKYIVVDVVGKAIINNWLFLATIQHTPRGNIVRCVYEGVDIPSKYYTCEPTCDHCNSRRARKDTYLIINTKTGALKQVGKSCLKDFTNGMDANAVAQYISMFDEVIAAGEPPIGGGCRAYYKTEDVVRISGECIKRFGYRNAQSGDSTAAMTYDFMDYFAGGCPQKTRAKIEHMIEESGYDCESEDAIQRAKNAIEWIKSKEDTSGYIANLRTACGDEYISGREFNLVCSLAQAYNREFPISTVAKKEKKESKSVHVGNVGDRITINPTSVSVISSWDSSYGYTMSTTFVYKIIDNNENVYTWKTSNFIDNNTKVITGTVKCHKEFNGELQTEITRCRLS